MRFNDSHIGFFALSVFLLPGEQTTLHVYEPKYLQLVNECIENEQTFGIPYQGKNMLSEYGSMVEVKQVLKTYGNGELDILVNCTHNFKLNHYEGQVEGKIYPGGTVLPLRAVENHITQEVYVPFSKYLQLLYGEEFHEKVGEYIGVLNISRMLHLTDDDKIKFIKITEAEKQKDFLLKKIKYLTILVKQEQQMEQNFYLN